MLKKTITYENPFTEEEVTEEHYFHISKADLVEMEMEEHKDEYTNKAGEKLTGMQAKLQRIVDSEDGKAIMAEFKDIIRRSYGVKDGQRFLKSPELWAEFSSTEAFSQLLFDLCTDAAAAADFINGIIPGNLEKIAEEVRQRAEQTGQAALAERAPNRAERRAAAKGGAETPAEEKVDAALANGDGSDDSAGPRILSLKEATEMDQNDLQAGLVSGRYKLS